MRHRCSSLQGMKVLDLSYRIAGPYCTKILASLGAEVIKVEKPGSGDVARELGPFLHDIPNPETSGLFLYLNTGKKSITLNLETNSGIKILKEMVKDVDVVVENFIPGVILALGIDYTSFEKINPALIMASVSNFGQSGPYRDYKSDEIVHQSMGGIMHTIGDPDREPLKIGGSVAQYYAGISAFVGIMLALNHRDETGCGQQIDVSLMEAIAFTQMYSIVHQAYAGVDRGREGGRVFPCTDGYVGAVRSAQRDLWPVFCHYIGRPDLIDEPKFIDMDSRIQNKDELEEIMGSWFAMRDKEEVYHSTQAAKLPFGYVATVADLLESPQYKSRGFFTSIDHPETGNITYPGDAFKMTETPLRQNRAPLLGEHNAEIYGRYLGYNKGDIVRLRERDII